MFLLCLFCVSSPCILASSLNSGFTMSLAQFTTYFDFLTGEYIRLMTEASLHRQHGNHGISYCTSEPCLVINRSIFSNQITIGCVFQLEFISVLLLHSTFLQLHVSGASVVRVLWVRGSVPCTGRSATISSPSSLASIPAPGPTSTTVTVYSAFSF